MPREWTEAELAIIEATPRTWVRWSKLTPEQVHEIRQRVDSLTTPYTLEQIARDFSITPQQVAHIARREKWRHKLYEPGGEWWKDRERRERRAERERRRALESADRVGNEGG